LKTVLVKLFDEGKVLPKFGFDVPFIISFLYLSFLFGESGNLG
jgi:hypothetical protein